MPFFFLVCLQVQRSVGVGALGVAVPAITASSAHSSYTPLVALSSMRPPDGGPHPHPHPHPHPPQQGYMLHHGYPPPIAGAQDSAFSAPPPPQPPPPPHQPYQDGCPPPCQPPYPPYPPDRPPFHPEQPPPSYHQGKPARATLQTNNCVNRASNFLLVSESGGKGRGRGRGAAKAEAERREELV